MKYSGKSDEVLMLAELNADNCYLLKDRGLSDLIILWNISEGTTLKVDGQEYVLPGNQVLCLTEFHKIEVLKIEQARMIKFNRPFYCISDHDNEVGCKGVLFFGASQLPAFSIPEEEQEKFEILWKMFSLEMESQDQLQEEMLQMMLKRFIILCTRIYKEQKKVTEEDQTEFSVVREFNYLVETHYMKYHKVADYAALLNKSPKTLSNLFSKYEHKTPLQIIKERIMLEARRMLLYTDKPVSEIAYETGYEDVQSFSRFFKAQEGISPREYREKK